MTRVCVQVVTFACLNFAFLECGENQVDVILMCVVHRDNEDNFTAFILDLMTKNSKIDCEGDADQPASYSLTSGHHVGIGHFLTEDKVNASKKYITLKKRSCQSLQEYKSKFSGLKAACGTKCSETWQMPHCSSKQHVQQIGVTANNTDST